MGSVNTHDYTMRSGKHKGQLITRVPLSYLKWMVCEKHTDAAIAKAEIDRRGTVTPTLDVSNHAIDRASIRLESAWKETRRKDEGICAWLIAMAGIALVQGKEIPDENANGATKLFWCGIKFVFQRDGEWPVLTTVGRANFVDIPAIQKARGLP